MNVLLIKSGIMKKIISLFILVMSFWTVSIAQEQSVAPKSIITRATFNSTKIINMQSTEMTSENSLQFLISHHFSPLWNDDASNQDNLAGMFGLNSGLAYTYLSFDYSPKSWMNIGLAAAGRSKYEGWLKFKILRQQTGAKNIPVSVAWYSAFNVNASKDASVSLNWNKYSYIHQLLIARKFSNTFSLQLIPSVIHFNVVPNGINNSNQVFSLGLGGKYKLSANKNITFEYARQFNMYENLIDKNGNIYNYKPDLASIGMEFNTGGHLFQFYIGNTTHSSNIDQLARNTTKLKLSNFALGFTINRSLDLGKK
jgi:hypothetical protein